MLLSAESVAVFEWLHRLFSERLCRAFVTFRNKERPNDLYSAYVASVGVRAHHCSDSSTACQRQTGQVS